MSRMRINKVEIRDADIFEILLDNFPDMIHSIDPKGNIVYTNRTAERLLGYTREELMSMNIRQIYADEILEALDRGFADLKKEGDKSVESLLKAKNGTRIPVEIRSFSIYDDNGKFIRTFSILRDIRPIKELQNSLVHAGRLAAIGEMASGVAHDINNPLTVILLSGDMITREIGRSDPANCQKALQKINQFVADIGKASGSIQKLVAHLRNFSRGIAEQHVPVDLFDVIADSVFMTQNKILTARVTVDNHLKKLKTFVMGSPNQLEQVFVNLISNACDAMEERNERKLTITVSDDVFNNAPAWACSVTDTGIGIPEELRDEVFQSFFTTKEKGEGTGLGLSISRSIIADHKGCIRLDSKQGKGSTFSIVLPKTQPPSPK